MRDAAPSKFFNVFPEKKKKCSPWGQKVELCLFPPLSSLLPPLPLPLPLFEEMAGIRFDSFSPRFFFLFPPFPTRVKVLLGMGWGPRVGAKIGALTRSIGVGDERLTFRSYISLFPLRKRHQQQQQQQHLTRRGVQPVPYCEGEGREGP